MKKLDVVNTLRLLGTTDVDGKPHSIYATRVSLFVPIVNEDEDNLEAAKIAAHEMIYGDIRQSLREMKTNLPKAHHAKVNKILRELERVLVKQPSSSEQQST